MKTKIVAFHILFLLVSAMTAPVLSGCDDEDAESVEPRLVVEGWINSGGYPEVLLTMSAVPDGEEGEIASNIVRWGVVKLSDGEREVVMTGRMESGIFPPFRYYNFEMKGVPGRSYTLTAEYRGQTVSSSVTMPSPTRITAIDSRPVEDAGGMRAVTLRFIAPEDSPAYYHVSVREAGVDSRFYPSMLGAVEVASPGEIIEVPVYRGRRSFDDKDFSPHFAVGSTVDVRLERVSESVFRFWRAYDNASLVSGSVFVGSPGSLPGNVAGGYGVWSAQGVDTRSITLE